MGNHRDKKEEDHKLKSTGQGEITESKLYEYLIEFNSLKPNGKNTKWILESELFDCEDLILQYWAEK
jgi:hypothetical protein